MMCVDGAVVRLQPPSRPNQRRVDQALPTRRRTYEMSDIDSDGLSPDICKALDCLAKLSRRDRSIL